MQNVEKMSQEELLHVLVSTKHGPGGSGRRGSCDPDCVKCAAEKLFSPAALREERARGGAPGEVHIQPITIHADDPDRFAFSLIDAFTKKVTVTAISLTQPGTVTFVGDPQASEVVYNDCKVTASEVAAETARLRANPPPPPQIVTLDRATGGALDELAALCGTERTPALIDGLTPEQCRERWLVNRSEQEIPSGCKRQVYDLTPAQIDAGKRYRTIQDSVHEAFEASLLRVLVKTSDAERKAREPSIVVDLEDE